MRERQVGGFASAGGAHQVALLNQERLIDLLDGARVFAHCGGDGAQAYRTALELVDDGAQDTVVHLVQTVLIDIQCGEGDLCDRQRDGAVAFDLGEVADTAQQQVGDTRRTTTARSDFVAIS